MKQKAISHSDFTYNNHIIPYQIVQTNRKTIAIMIDKEAKVIIRAPLYMREKQIKRLVLENREQIYKAYQKANIKADIEPIISMKDLSTIPFYGKEFPIYMQSTDARERIVDDGKCIEIFVHSDKEDTYERAGNMLEVWYRKKGKDIFVKTAQMYAEMMGTSFEKIAIKNQKTRWGSCSNHKNLNFNWRLLMMPKEVLDYVVIHELAHTIEMNHSKQFWAHVEKLMPNYKMYRKFLKEETRKYRIEV
jgi:predicted metal-dependent hydrolase